MAFRRLRKLVITAADLLEAQDIMRVINNLQNNVDDAITPMANKLQNDSTILNNILLKTDGYVTPANIVNHTLGRQLAGWKIVRQRGQAHIWDGQDLNPSPNLTLWLHTDTQVTVDIEVF